MLLFCRRDQTPADRDALLTAARAAGFHPQPMGDRIIGLFGAGRVDELSGLAGVERIAESDGTPLLATLNGHEPTIVPVGAARVGEGFTVIAGPCAVEDRQRVLDLAHRVKDAGATILRGGAFKPRTSPYSFRGLGRTGLEYLRAAGDATGLPVVTEVMDTRDVPLVAEHADMLQIGSRNMMNYSLLVEAGRAGRPVFLKRGMSATLDELLHAAEYLLLEGVPGVVLCERGIRTFSTEMRNTLDVSVVPLLRERTHLPLIVDPSHATGSSRFVPAMARAAAAAGAIGIMVEVHDDPGVALSDGPQALHPDTLRDLIRQLREISAIVNRTPAPPAT
jgi:3-deoxy-7-phosphoheptulonate synthase